MVCLGFGHGIEAHGRFVHAVGLDTELATVASGKGALGLVLLLDDLLVLVDDLRGCNCQPRASSAQYLVAKLGNVDRVLGLGRSVDSLGALALLLLRHVVLGKHRKIERGREKRKGGKKGKRVIPAARPVRAAYDKVWVGVPVVVVGGRRNDVVSSGCLPHVFLFRSGLVGNLRGVFCVNTNQINQTVIGVGGARDPVR